MAKKDQFSWAEMDIRGSPVHYKIQPQLGHLKLTPCFRIGGAEDNFVFDTFIRFLDRNSICCTGMNSEKPILASEVTQDAETG